MNYDRNKLHCYRNSKSCKNNNFSSFMRGRLNILAFNLPENNSDSPELSRWQSVTQSTLTEACCLEPCELVEVQLQRTATTPPPTMAFYVSCGCCCFSGSTN